MFAGFVLPRAHWDTRCGPEGFGGTAVQPSGDDTAITRDDDWVRATRTLTYRVSMDQARASLYSCTSVGSLTLGVGPDGRVAVEAQVIGQGHTEDEARAESRRFDPVVQGAPGRVLAYEPHRHGEFWGERRAWMSVRILVPASTLVEADLGTGTGKVVVDGPRLAGLDASTGTGSITLSPSWAEGALDLSTGTGRIEGRFPALGDATFDASTGTSGIELAVPGDERHGYAIDASTGTGGIRLELPDLDSAEQSRGHHEATTRDFDSRAVKVRMDLSTGTGAITVTST